MAGNTYGTLFKLTTFGESHGAALGAIIDGCPANIEISLKEIQEELNKRKPMPKVITSTTRDEADTVEILSGFFEGKTTGTPISFLIRNTDADSSEYEKLKNVFRPGHADYTYWKKYKNRDWRGGGRASGRETAARVAGGAVAKKLLSTLGVHIETIVKPPYSNDFFEILRENKDSVGGVISVNIKGVPAGWGEPVFDKLDAELAKAVLSIGGVKGIEFGAGFACAKMSGSEYNDQMSPPFEFDTNNAGGILGGISNGNDIIFKVAVKPVSSIGVKQKTVNIKGEPVEIKIEGRHDVFLPPRVAPVIEAMCALVLADMYLRQKAL